LFPRFEHKTDTKLLPAKQVKVIGIVIWDGKLNLSTSKLNKGELAVTDTVYVQLSPFTIDD
jgi:hypothetical protein